VANDGDGLTPFQLDIAQLFFALPASEHFLLAGGAALLAQHLTARPTQDLDFFTRPGAGSVTRARDEFVAAARGRGWTVEVVRDTETFCRLLVHGPEDLLVDLALDSAPRRPATASIAGPQTASASALINAWAKLDTIARSRSGLAWASCSCNHADMSILGVAVIAYSSSRVP